MQVTKLFDIQQNPTALGTFVALHRIDKLSRDPDFWSARALCQCRYPNCAATKARAGDTAAGLCQATTINAYDCAAGGG